jgi:hypothetical protein
MENLVDDSLNELAQYCLYVLASAHFRLPSSSDAQVETLHSGRGAALLTEPVHQSCFSANLPKQGRGQYKQKPRDTVIEFYSLRRFFVLNRVSKARQVSKVQQGLHLSTLRVLRCAL